MISDEQLKKIEQILTPEQMKELKTGRLPVGRPLDVVVLVGANNECHLLLACDGVMVRLLAYMLQNPKFAFANRQEGEYILSAKPYKRFVRNYLERNGHVSPTPMPNKLTFLRIKRHWAADFSPF